MGFYESSCLVEEQTPLKYRVVGSERFSFDRARLPALQVLESHQETTLIVTIFVSDRQSFWTVDTFEGLRYNPLSLQKYLYVAANPVNRIDPSGRLLIADLVVSAIGRTVDHLGYLMAKTAFMRAQSILRNTIPSFSIYGEWCGPGWCNGSWQAEDDFFNLAASISTTYIPPWDEVDTCCFHHDACVAGYSKSSNGPLVHNPSVTKNTCDSNFCGCMKTAQCPNRSPGCVFAKLRMQAWCSIGFPF